MDVRQLVAVKNIIGEALAAGREISSLPLACRMSRLQFADMQAGYDFTQRNYLRAAAHVVTYISGGGKPERMHLEILRQAEQHYPVSHALPVGPYARALIECCRD